MQVAQSSPRTCFFYTGTKQIQYCNGNTYARNRERIQSVRGVITVRFREHTLARLWCQILQGGGVHLTKMRCLLQIEKSKFWQIWQEAGQQDKESPSQATDIIAHFRNFGKCRSKCHEGVRTAHLCGFGDFVQKKRAVTVFTRVISRPAITLYSPYIHALYNQGEPKRVPKASPCL